MLYVLVIILFLDVVFDHFSLAGCWDPWTSWTQNAFLPTYSLFAAAAAMKNTSSFLIPHFYV